MLLFSYKPIRLILARLCGDAYLRRRQAHCV